MTALLQKFALDALLLVITGAGIAVVLIADGYIQFVFGLVAITTILCVGLNVLYGLTGLISLGQVGFFAIGAYASGICMQAGLSFWLALPVATLIAAMAGALLAIPAVRMAGPFLAMITIAFAFIIEHGAIEWRSVTGGQNGLMGFSMPQMAGYTFVERDLVLLCLVLAALSLFLFRRLANSGWGMAMTGMRDAEIAASSIGYRPFVVKSLAFVVAAAMAGLAGSLFTPLMMFIAPSNFPFSQSILYLFAVLIGGAGTVLGPLAGSLVTVLLPEFLSALAEYRLLFFGGLLICILLIAPRGLVGTLAALLPAHKRSIVASSREQTQQFLTPDATAQPLSINNLGISFGGVRAAHDLSMSFQPAKITALIGPNGAGKTTVLNMVSGFYRPSEGEILYDGQNLAGAPAHDIARKGIARTYQTTRLFENMSVIANVVAGLPRGKLNNPWTEIQSAENLSMAAGLLRFCGYSGELEKRAGDLPHVDRRLVEIARALALRPTVLLLDEPAAGLMRADKNRLATLLKQLANLGLAVVLVEHDMDLVMEISDHIQVMDAGKPIASGTASQVQADATVIEAYLGDGASSVQARKTTLDSARTPLLTVRQLSAGYGAAPVLENISLEVGRGELVALLGANGAGKSTFLSAVSGLHRPVQGDITLNGESIHTLAPHQLVARGLVLVPEGRQVFPELTVRENIELGAYKRANEYTPDEVDAQLQRFPRLKERITSRAGLLSGGEQQMLAIARGLIADPQILLLDEPSLGLAPTMVEELYTTLSELRDEGITLLLVDQMAKLALTIADRAYVIEQGRIVVEGNAALLAADPRLTAAYMGSDKSPAHNDKVPA